MFYCFQRKMAVYLQLEIKKSALTSPVVILVCGRPKAVKERALLVLLKPSFLGIKKAVPNTFFAMFILKLMSLSEDNDVKKIRNQYFINEKIPYKMKMCLWNVDSIFSSYASLPLLPPSRAAAE